MNSDGIDSYRSPVLLSSWSVKTHCFDQRLPSKPNRMERPAEELKMQEASTLKVITHHNETDDLRK